MSLAMNRLRCWRERFPRVSGDEPIMDAAEDVAVVFSPRERG